MIQTYVAYGYRLGGPGSWNLTGIAPADRLITPWFNETNPTHDLAVQATNELTKSITGPQAFERLLAFDDRNPITFDTAIEVSPPAWTREAHAGPPLGWQIPETSPLLDLDRPATNSYVLIANDSVTHLEAEEAALYDDSEEEQPHGIADLRVNWDSLLDAALTEVGLQMPVLPDWFWYRTETTV